MRILLVNTFYYPKLTGGAEVSVQQLAEGLKAAGHDVFVLATGETDKIYHHNGVVIITLRQRNIYSTFNVTKQSQLKKLLWHLIDSANALYQFKFNAIVKRLNLDLVHTNNIQGLSPFIWHVVKKNNIKLLHTMRDYYLLCHKCNMFDNDKNCSRLCGACKVTHHIKRQFSSLPDQYIAISNHVLKSHQSHLNMPNAEVIYNAVKQPSNLTEQHQNVIIRFGFIGRVTPDKGLNYLADELMKLDEGLRSTFKISFAGKGDADYVSSLQHKLADINFEFLGAVNSADFYKSIDVLIVPALWNEPFGRTVIEALSYAVPVCQSDRGGLKEIFVPASSWLFSPVQDTLSSILNYILTNRNEVALKKLNCAKHAAQFNNDVYINNHLKLYYQLLEGKAGELPALQSNVLVNG